MYALLRHKSHALELIYPSDLKYRMQSFTEKHSSISYTKHHSKFDNSWNFLSQNSRINKDKLSCLLCIKCNLIIYILPILYTRYESLFVFNTITVTKQ